ncbi:hypothetical protein AAF712_011672 [Marasmius tenuissimus]|uniref:Uncharacterized protein n=1 Tax=Marasmius tenuissimus TaxID=585030 RepID=A0ABR2ZKM2_9AGAR
MSTTVDELNEQLFRSLEASPPDLDLETLSTRSFLYTFCGIEDYTPTFPSESLSLVSDWSLAFLNTENPFARSTGPDIAPTKRKFELEEADFDAELRRTRTRTSSGTGILPSFNCLSNLDFRAHRAFREYRSSRGYDGALGNNKTLRSRSVTVSSIADVARRVTDRRRIFTTQDASVFSGPNYSPAVFDTENSPAAHAHKDTPEVIPKSPSKLSGLSNCDINVSKSSAPSPSNLFSFTPASDREASLDSPLLQLLAEFNSSSNAIPDHSPPSPLDTRSLSGSSFSDTLSSKHSIEVPELQEHTVRSPSKSRTILESPFKSHFFSVLFHLDDQDPCQFKRLGRRRKPFGSCSQFSARAVYYAS